MSLLTTEEVAKQEGIAFSTLKRWLDVVEVPHEKNSQGHRRFGPEGLEVIRQIKELRLDNDRALESIRMIMSHGRAQRGPAVSPEASSAQAELITEQVETEPTASPAAEPSVELTIEVSPARAEPEPTSGPGLADIRAAVVQVLEEQNELAEKYARATYSIGELTATVKAGEAERVRLAGELMKAMATAEQVPELRAQLARAEAELSSARAQLTASPRGRPWWKVWG